MHRVWNLIGSDYGRIYSPRKLLKAIEHPVSNWVWLWTTIIKDNCAETTVIQSYCEHVQGYILWGISGQTDFTKIFQPVTKQINKKTTTAWKNQQENKRLGQHYKPNRSKKHQEKILCTVQCTFFSVMHGRLSRKTKLNKLK